MKEVDVLCVDDNEDYCYFILKAFESCSDPINYRILHRGIPAVDCLQECSENQIVPRLILLDLDLPDLHGKEVLKKIKESNKLRQVPVVIFSSSENPQDVEQAFNYGANAYVCKPSGYKKLKVFIQNTCNFWLNHNITGLKQN